MKPCIKKYRPAEEYYIDEGCYITELSNSKDDSELSIARARVEPGVTTEIHKLLNTNERYVIVSGEGVIELDGSFSQSVKANDVVLIPQDCSQRITNTGYKDLIFLAICAPRFKSENYATLEK